MSQRLSPAKLAQMHRFWLWHLMVLSIGLVAATSLSLFWVVPQLYQRMGLFFGTLFVYLLFAYLALPEAWKYYERYLAFKTYPGRTQTHAGIPSDPLNVALIGRKRRVMRSLIKGGWVPADAITLRSAFKMASSILLKHPYQSAPVSDLFLLGRRQDLAFERESGDSPRQRHHVRLWRAKRLAGRGYLWIGAASFDRNAGVSHLTGQITHHIDGAIDSERDRLITDLKNAHSLRRVSVVPNGQLSDEGKNAGGDEYFTDGDIHVGILI